MVLEEDKILELIITPENTNLSDYRNKHKIFNLYFNGGDIASEIEKIDTFENNKQRQLRQKIARSPKDLLQRLLNPFKKVFSATGGSEQIEIKPQARKDEFISHLSKLPEGISLSKWMYNYWVEAYITDPNGVIFIETENTDNPKSYPTYKSTSVIHDYKLKWDDFNYIILKHGKYTIGKKEIEVFRVVDDTKDALYYVEGKVLKIFKTENEMAISHKKGFIPAILVSNIVDKMTGGRKSFISQIDELLKEYLRESSVLSIFKFLHAYPKYWQYASKCVKCKGVGVVDDSSVEKGKSTCRSCKGSGININPDISDGIMLPLPQDNEDPIIAPNIAGFSVPPIDTWDKMEKSLDDLERKMEFALIGTTIEEEKSNTATGRFIDAQPLYNALHDFSTTEEMIKEKLAQYMAQWMYGNNYGQITIKNGKRFICESPDSIWEKYITSKDKSAPISTLDYLYKQYLLSEYQNDAQMYEQKLKEFYLEPMVHYSISDLNSLNIETSDIVLKKIYFSEWLTTKPNFFKDLEKLEKELIDYYNKNISKNENITQQQGIN